MSAFSYLILNSLDAAGNLAAEQVIFDTLPRGESCFLLWQNRSAVVIGRHQDALAEIDHAFVEENGIQLVRRISGGGAVYHDLGNLNYSVITEAQGSKAPDMALFCAPVLPQSISTVLSPAKAARHWPCPTSIAATVPSAEE